MWILSWREGNGNAGKDDDGADNLRRGGEILKPQELDAHSERYGDTMDDEHREARTDALEGLEEGYIAEAKTNGTTGEEQPENVRLKMSGAVRKKKKRDGGEYDWCDNEARKICLRATQELGGSPRGNGGQAKEHSAKQRGEHGWTGVRRGAGFVTPNDTKGLHRVGRCLTSAHEAGLVDINDGDEFEH